MRLGYAVLIAWGGFALFTNLGEAYLWGDEAQTALHARSILVHGVPQDKLDGYFITQEFSGTNDESGVWIWNTWLSHYLTAASFQLLGVSTFAARFPSAVIGLLALILSVPVFRRIARDSWTAWLGAGLMAASVPALLYMRQCRYYSLTMLGTLGLMDGIWSLREGRRRGVWLFSASLALLFYSFFPFAYAVAVVPAAWLWLRPGHSRTRAFLIRSLAITVLICLPGFLYHKAWSRPPEHLQSLGATLSHLKALLLWINHFLFPGLLLAVLALRRARMAHGGFWAAFLLIPLVYFSWSSPEAYTRYLVGLFPAVFLVLAMVLTALAGRRKRLAVLAAILLSATNVLHIMPVKALGLGIPAIPPSSLTEAMGFKLAAVGWDSYPYRFLRELTGSYDGPMEVLMRYLDGRARPGESLLCVSEAMSARFYAPPGLRVLYPAESLQDIPDWIAPTPWLAFYPELARRIGGLVAEGRYEVVRLEAPDLVWENQPDILYHHFTLPPSRGKILYRSRASRALTR